MNGRRFNYTEATRAFTLLELLVVMGIISVLLVAIVPAVTSLSKSSGRKAAASQLVGAFEQARAEAMKSGRMTYVVFPTFPAGTSKATQDRYNFRSYAIFEDDPANPTTPKQLTSWKTLPTGVAMRASGTSSLTTTLAQSSSLTPSPTLAFSADQKASPVFYCAQFNSNGEIENPPNDITLGIFEGFVNGGTEVLTSKKSGGEPLATESMKVSRLTGRASYATP